MVIEIFIYLYMHLQVWYEKLFLEFQGKF